MLILGLFIGLVIGFILGRAIKPAEQKPDESFKYDYDYSDPDEREEKNSHYYYGIKDDKGIEREWLDPDPNAEPNNLFFGKKIVFTGNLQQIDRNDAAMYVSKLGGDVNTSISKKTDIVVVGENPGPSKMEKIKWINNTREPSIEIIDESGFIARISEYFDIN